MRKGRSGNDGQGRTGGGDVRIRGELYGGIKGREKGREKGAGLVGIGSRDFRYRCYFKCLRTWVVILCGHLLYHNTRRPRLINAM